MGDDLSELRILYHTKVVKEDIPRLGASVRGRIRRAIESKLTRQPEQFAKPLAFNRTGLWSLRVGDWRVVFAMRAEELWILRIGHRSEIYKALDREIPESKP